jgi:hypothetical protein
MAARTDTGEQSNHRKVYAKGFFDGFEAATAGKVDVFMNQKKQKELLNSQSALAQKVFEATPMVEPWDVSTIGREVYRLYNSTQDHRTVYGCLTALKASGLVREPQKGFFLRTPVRAVIEKHHEEKEEEVLTTKGNTIEIAEGSRMPQTLAAEPIARLGDIAATAKHLADQLRKLAGQIEEAAIDIELQQEQAGKDSQALKQLRALLQNIGTTP